MNKPFDLRKTTPRDRQLIVAAFCAGQANIEAKMLRYGRPPIEQTSLGIRKAARQLCMKLARNPGSAPGTFVLRRNLERALDWQDLHELS